MFLVCVIPPFGPIGNGDTTVTDQTWLCTAAHHVYRGGNLVAEITIIICQSLYAPRGRQKERGLRLLTLPP